MSKNINEVLDSSFEDEVLNSEVPVMVDFWAEWCGPCKALAPKIEQVATEYGDQVKILKMNVDHNQKTPAKYGIRGIPTLILFQDGKPVNQLVGNVSIDDLKSFIDNVL